MGVKKGDIYNLDVLNKGLGKTLSPEGGDISGLYMDDGYLFFRTDPIETAVYNDTIDYEIRIIEKKIIALEKLRRGTTNWFSRLWIYFLIQNEKSKLTKYKQK